MVAYVTRLYVVIFLDVMEDMYNIFKRTLKSSVTKEPALVVPEHLLLLFLEILDRDALSNRRPLEKPTRNFRQSLGVCEAEIVENLFRISLP